MAHLHSVYDTDSHFSINIVTRALKNEASTKVTVMQYDHNSERFTFEIPRYIEEHDMSLCNRVEVHYQNGANSGVYEVDDLDVSPNGDDVVICSWLISQNATQNAAALDFRLTFKCVADDGTLEYVWSTAMHKGISVSSGIHNSEIIVEQYADVLEQWKNELEAAGGGGGTGTVTDHPVKYVESPKENKVCLRDLESGIYILYGYFKPFPGSNSTIIVDNLLMHTYTSDAYTYMSCITADGIVNVYEILVDENNSYGYTYTRYRYKLDELNEKISTLENLISANGINLTDRTTGVVHTLYIDNGKLTMEESGV